MNAPAFVRDGRDDQREMGGGGILAAERPRRKRPAWLPHGDAPDERPQVQQWMEEDEAERLLPDAPPPMTEVLAVGRQERYAVRRQVYNDMVSKVAAGETPSVDAFADQALHLLDRWWGPGSQVPDAMAVHWGGERLLWANPPFSMMLDVVYKIERDKARVLLVFPHWTTSVWFPLVQAMTVRKYYHKQGKMLFETEEGTVGGTKWAVWVALVDGNLEKDVDDHLWEMGHEETEFKATAAGRRRWRRKMEQQRNDHMYY